MVMTLEYAGGWLRQRYGGSERGASLVEYALLLGLIAVVCVVAVTSVGTHLGQSYDDSNTSIFGTP